MIQITPLSPIYYLPENLYSLFSRPGRELTVRVLQIEGKRLFLELGGEKFQAQISGAFNPEDFRIGETLRVKVTQTEPQIILKLINPQKSPELTFMVSAHLHPEDQKIRAEKEVTEDFFQLIQVLRDSLRRVSKRSEEEENLEEPFLSKIRIKTPVYQGDKFLIPIMFPEGSGWGYFEFQVPVEREDRTKLFALRMFFPYLGLIEANFFLKSSILDVCIDFANVESLKFARGNLKELKEALSVKEGLINIYLQHKSLEPGFILESRG